MLTERDHAIAELAAQKVLAALEAREKPRMSGQEAARMLGLSYPTFKERHVDGGDLFYVGGTKRFARKDVLRLKRKLEGLAA
jgi:hypothetical protein